ncbi:MAG: histidine phosphatase family protein [Acidobacteria bacterium]|nr:histidine phosphatase family protein [Acidobacteriota bacterium]
MNRTLYLVRHCQATGQAPEAPLTSEGLAQAQMLAEFLSGSSIERIVSSPFTRAVQSIEPLAQRLGLEIKMDGRLIEAALSTIDYPDWLDRLRSTFSDFDLSFEGGESGRAATARAVAAMSDALQSGTDSTLIVTHGRLMTLILKHFDPTYGFEDWRKLSAPDVYRVTLKDGGSDVERLWK